MHLHRLVTMNDFIRSPILLLLILLTLPAMSSAQENRKGQAWEKAGWTTILQGAYVRQFDTDMDRGGKFNVDRLAIRGALSYAMDYRRSLSFAVGYDFDGYDFSGEGGFASLRPWEDINSFRISTPLRWRFSQEWSMFVVPILRFTAESGADLGDGATGGGFVGFTHRFGDRLTLGPGIGVLSQIEDNTTVFPVLLIKWKITDRLSLETGRGLGATLGPGLILSYKASHKLNLSLGGRVERLRFRLDKDGIAPKGVGEDRSFPLFGGVTYNFSRRIQASILGGVELGGELRLNDENGNRIAEEDYDPAGFLGFAFRVWF